MKNKRTEPGSYTELRMWAEAFADAQAARVAFENKKRSGTVDAAAFDVAVELYKDAEKYLGAQMTACYRVTVPAGVLKWQRETAGVGEHTLARLLGVTGDPRTAYPRHWEGSGAGERVLVEDEPHERTIGELWQYCGVGRVKNREVKGDAAALMANGSPDAKKLAYLLAHSQVVTGARGGGFYRPFWDAVRAKYGQKAHPAPCTGGFSGNLYVKCKTHEGGGYAEEGDPYQPSHVQAIAYRLTGKEILRDLWLACGPVPGHLDNHRHRHGGQGPLK